MALNRLQFGVALLIGFFLLATLFAVLLYALAPATPAVRGPRSEEHTSELQSQSNLVCRLLLEKKTRANSHSTRRHRPTGTTASDRQPARAATLLNSIPAPFRFAPVLRWSAQNVTPLATASIAT